MGMHSARDFLGVCVRAGSRVKTAKQMYSGRRSRSKVDEARDILANVVLCHIPAPKYDFQQKVRHLPLPAPGLACFEAPCTDKLTSWLFV